MNYSIHQRGMNTLFRKKKIWISVDGGGTEARFCACNENNELLFNKSYGSTNYKSKRQSKGRLVKSSSD